MSFNVQKNFGISDNTTSLYVVNLCSKNRAFDNVIILHYIPTKHPTVLLSRKVAIKLVLAKRVFCFVRVLSYTILKGYSEGMKWGIQRAHATYCVLGNATSSFLQGKLLLPRIDEDCRIYMCGICVNLGRGEISGSTSYIHQACVYLMGVTESCELFKDLEGEPMPL